MVILTDQYNHPLLANAAGLEPATTYVTGKYSNQLNYASLKTHKYNLGYVYIFYLVEVSLPPHLGDHSTSPER